MRNRGGIYHPLLPVLRGSLLFGCGLTALGHPRVAFNSVAEDLSQEIDGGRGLGFKILPAALD